MRREWSDAVEAHEGLGCRVCGQFPRDLGHVLGRALDRPPGEKAKVVRVDPLGVVPLCKAFHHPQYDDHRLDLFPYLTAEEIGYAVSRVGYGSAMRRIRGRQYWERGGTQVVP